MRVASFFILVTGMTATDNFRAPGKSASASGQGFDHGQYGDNAIRMGIHHCKHVIIIRQSATLFKIFAPHLFYVEPSTRMIHAPNKASATGGL